MTRFVFKNEQKSPRWQIILLNEYDGQEGCNKPYFP